MAKKIKKTYTKSELMSITPEQLNAMKVQDLRYVISSMNRIIRRQQVTLENLIEKNPNLYSPALDKIKKRVPEAYTKDGSLKTLNQLRNEFKLGQEIFGLKTYETKNVVKVYENMKQRLVEEKGVTVDPKEFWEVYNKFLELNKETKYKFPSDPVQTLIANKFIEIGSADPVEIFEKVKEGYEEDETKRSETERKLLEALSNGKKFKGRNDS